MGEAEENVHQCSRCCSVLANHVIDNDISAVYCAACEMQGCGPPLVSRFRNTSHDCLEVASLSSSHNMLSVSDDDDDDGHSQSHSLNDSALHNDVLGLSESVNVTFVNGIDSGINDGSFVSAGVACSDQLQDSDCVSTGTGQSSMARLTKLAEMLAQDEDISAHYSSVAADDDDGDDDDAVCYQSGIDSEDKSSIKHATRLSSDCDGGLPAELSNDEADGNLDEVVVPKADQQTLDAVSRIFSVTRCLLVSHQTTVNSVRGS